MEAGKARVRSALAVGTVAAVLAVVLCLTLTPSGAGRTGPRSPAPGGAFPPWAQRLLTALGVGVAGFVAGFGLQFLLSGLKPDTQRPGQKRLVVRSSPEREIGNVEEIAALCVRRACRRRGSRGREPEPDTRAKTQAQGGTHPPDPDGG